MTGAERPAPLVPADADLRDFPFMPLDVIRLRDSGLSAKATGDEFRAAVLLWCAAWHQQPAGSLPTDDAELANLCGYGRAIRDWQKLRAGALRGWIECADGRLYHHTLARHAMNAWAAKQRQRRRMDRRLEIFSDEWAALRSTVFARDGYRCRYCGAHGARLEADHVVPASRGGASVLENLVTACRPCNRSKGSKSLKEWRQ